MNAALLAALNQQARHLLDEQRHAAGALAHPLDQLFGQRMARRNFADHARDAGAIQRGQRDQAVVRAQAPRRAELRTGRSQHEQRRLRTAVGEARARGRATLGRPNAGLRKRGQPAGTAPPPEPRRSLPPVAFAAALQAGDSRRGQAATGCPRAVRARAHVRLGRGRSAATCLQGRRGAARLAHPHQIAAGPIRRLDAAACSAGAARRSIRSRCAASPPSCEWNSSISRDLPRPGSPTISTSWPSPARARSQRRVSRPSSSSRPTNGVSVRAPPLRPPPLARTMREELDGLGRRP